MDNKDKNAWIINRFNFHKPGMVLRAGEFSELSKIYLPNTIKHIVFCNDFFCFVTYDNLYSINYVKYWVDSEHKISSIDEDYAKLNYRSQEYLVISTSQKIIGLQATASGLFALTKDDENNLHILKWKTISNSFYENPSMFLILGANKNYDSDNIQFIVSDTQKGNFILFYGSIDGTVYTGKLIEGHKSIGIENIEKLDFFSSNAEFLFTTCEDSIKPKQSHIEYWGFEKKSKKLFVYKHALSQTEKSKLYIKYLDNIDKNFTFLEVSAMAMVRLRVFGVSKQNDAIYNDIIFMATSQPNVIYTIFQINDNNYNLVPLIFDSGINSNIFDSMAFRQPLGYIDSICSVNGQLMLYGNKNSNDWKIYKFPYLDFPQNDLEKSIAARFYDS